MVILKRKLQFLKYCNVIVTNKSNIDIVKIYNFLFKITCKIKIEIVLIKKIININYYK